MRARALAAAMVAAAFTSAAPAAAGAATEGYVVLYERSVSSPAAETTRQEQARGFRARFRYGHAVKGFAARLGPGQAAALRADPDVAAVVPDRPVSASEAIAPGEPLPPTGVRRIRAATADTVSDQGAAVAVLDTGIDLDNPDLDAVDAVNCITPSATADDDDGHGTHVAGTIGAANNGAGVVGVAPGTKLYAVKVLDAAGNGTLSSVVCGLDWVADHAAAEDIAVANMSLGGDSGRRAACPDGTDPMHTAICGVVEAGVLPVVAAGNEGQDFGGSDHKWAEAPAVYPEVLTVSAIADQDGRPGGLAGSFACPDRNKGLDDTPAPFSNYATRPADGAHLIAAPGLCITSAAPGGGSAVMSGTSMATPHVAAAVARCVSSGGLPGPCAGMPPGQIVARMRADAAAVVGADPSYGFTQTAAGRDFGPLVATGAIPRAAPDPDPGGTSTPPPSDPAPPEGAIAAGEAEDTTPPLVIDATAPTATLAATGRRLGALIRHGLPIVVRCGEECSARARLVVGAATARRLGLKPGSPLARAGSSALGSELHLVLRPGARTRERLRGLGRLRARVVVTVTDAAGNADRVTRRLTLRR